MIRITVLLLAIILNVHGSSGEVHFELIHSDRPEAVRPDTLLYENEFAFNSQPVHIRHRRDVGPEAADKLAKLKRSDKLVNDAKASQIKPDRLDGSISASGSGSASASGSASTSTYNSGSTDANSPFTTPADLPELDGLLKPPPANFSLPTQNRDDHHTYYNTSLYTNNETYAQQLWIQPDQPNCVRHSMLSQAHRRAATVKLTFRFPFYGHEIENVTIATGGFLYLGEAIHTWLAATQYIAPLMANFNTSISNRSGVYYCDNGTAFTVQWDQVHLQEANPLITNPKPSPPFSFQATLHKSGEIVFVYKDIPIAIDKINEDKHPVKVGISDAYIIERNIIFIRRKTIYEYHKAELKTYPISSNSVFYFRPLPTCNSLKDCQSCLKPNATDFECGWCDSLNRCSDGYDRHRNSWIANRCANQTVEKKCTSGDSSSSSHDSLSNGSSSFVSGQVSPDVSPGASSRSRSGLWTFLFIVIVLKIAFWTAYAYKNPHSPSGQFLIKYRPTQWRFGQNDS